MRFDIGVRLAKLALSGHEPADEFRRALPPDSWEFVV
jgi:hypothetical protein